MARGTASSWTRDDILLTATETFALLPRPSKAATNAFVTLLTEYWDDVSVPVQRTVEGLLRGARRVSGAALEALDQCIEASTRDGDERADAENKFSGNAESPSASADVPSETTPESEMAEPGAAKPIPMPGRRVTIVRHVRTGRTEHSKAGKPDAPVEAAATPTADAQMPANQPEIAATAKPAGESERIDEAQPAPAAQHALAALRYLAHTGEAGPAIQPIEIARRLRNARSPAAELASLLNLPHDAATMIADDPRGLLVACRALGIGAAEVRGLLARWHASVPRGIEETYCTLDLGDCLAAVSAWRRAAKADAETLRRSA